MDKYYENIRTCLLKNEVYKKVKDYSKNKNDLETYYNVGKELSMAGKHYGENIIGKYAKKLNNDIGKNYNITSLKRYRQFYIMIEKGATLSHQLNWSHYSELIPLNDINKINYYISNINEFNLSVRQLRKKIKSNEYERLPIETRNKLILKEKTNINDLVPNPILIKSNNLKENLTEYALKQSILNDLDNFLRGLGIGYMYVGNEYKIKIGNSYNYIDLLLFNIEYNCYVVIELKVVPLKKEHIGQIEIYINYIDSNIKKSYHDKTIGIIICKKENKYIIEYSSDKRIIARFYELV